MGISSGKSQADAANSAKAEDDGLYAPSLLRKEDELEAVLIISEALGGKLDLQHVLGVAMDAVGKIVQAEGASILMIDPETGEMSFHIATGPGAEMVKTIRLPAGAGICGHVARSGKPLIVNDAQNDPRLYQRVDRTTGVKTNNLLCVPLSSSKRLWGVLELINKRRGIFDGRDLRLAQVAAGQIALALENAHLHTEIVNHERMAAIGRTVSGLAHCIKNILNGIRSGSAIVDRCLNTQNFEKIEHGWDVVRKNNNMLSTLVLDMLSMARDTKFHPFPTDVNDLADQICQLMAERAGGRGIGITCTPAPGLTDVMTDPTQLYRCLLNLVSNAVDACGEGGHMRVRVYRAQGRPRITISVADDGAGIPAENRSKLFMEFFTTKGNQGTGLGLPVTKKLIHAMGGKIAFHSVLDKGTKFVIALPFDGTPVN